MKVFLSLKYLHFKFYLTLENYSFVLLNSTSFNLHCVLFTFSNNCGTFGVRQVTEKRWEQNGEE